jgi:hypothetical protein
MIYNSVVVTHNRKIGSWKVCTLVGYVCSLFDGLGPVLRCCSNEACSANRSDFKMFAVDSSKKKKGLIRQFLKICRVRLEKKSELNLI